MDPLHTTGGKDEQNIAFSGLHLAHRLSFLCCAVCLCFLCLRPVSLVPITASVSILSILDHPFLFSLTFIFYVCNQHK
jgi:hypothetical protein